MPTPTDRNREEVAREDASGRTLDVGAGQGEPMKAVTCRALCRNNLSNFAEPCAEACITGAGVAFDCEHASTVWGNDAQHVLDALFASAPSIAAVASEMLGALEELTEAAERDLKINKNEDAEYAPGWWSIRCENAIKAARSAISLARSSGIKGE